MKIAFILLNALLFLSCGNEAHLSSSMPSPEMSESNEQTNRQVEKSNCQINLTSLKTFYGSVPNDFRDVERDTQFIEQLRRCPKGEVINTLTSLLNFSKNDYEIETKVTYLFIKLDHNKAQNKRHLLDLFNSYPYEKFENLGIESDRVIDMVCDVIFRDDDSQEFLADMFELKTNGASSTVLYGNLADVFERTPELFLRELNKKSKSKREDVYSSLCTEISKDKLLDHLSKINKTSDVYSLSQEMSGFVDKSNVCRNF